MGAYLASTPAEFRDQARNLSLFDLDNVEQFSWSIYRSMRSRDEFKVRSWESDQQLQDSVPTVHHASIQTPTETPAIKIIENQVGFAFISSVQTVAIGR